MLSRKLDVEEFTIRNSTDLDFNEAHEEVKKSYITWPAVQCSIAKKFPFMRKTIKRQDLMAVYLTYKSQGDDEYAEDYRKLAYSIYGEGNWSNNDRRRKGLGTIGFRKGWNL